MVAYGPWNLEKRKKMLAHTSRPKLGVLTQILLVFFGKTYKAGIEGMHKTDQAEDL